MNQAILEQISELDRLADSRDDAWQISLEEGWMLHQIALSSNAKLIVEVGTSYGFSGLFWGAALQRTGGKLHTIDKSQKKYDSSHETFAKAGLSHIITNHLGEAHAVLPQIHGSIDLAFVDADKQSTQAYFDLIWPKLRVGGSLIVDNASTHEAQLAEFVAGLRGRKDAIGTRVEIGNGIEWAVKSAGAK